MATNPAQSPEFSTPKFYYGYVIVAAAFFTKLLMWGSNYCFGIFFEPILTEFGWSRAITSGAFSLAIIMEGLGSMFMGRMADRHGPRMVLITCGILFGLGFVLMSKVQAVWHLYLFYGIVVGLGLSGSFVGTMWAVANWFTRQRGKMMALVVSSLGIGTMIMVPVANKLILETGWRNAFVIVGLGAMTLIVLSALFIKTCPVNGKTNLEGDAGFKNAEDAVSGIPIKTALKSMQLWLICLIISLWALGKYAILVHIATHAIDLGYSATSSANILTIIGGATFVTTIVLGMSVDQFGSFRTFIAGLAVMAASLVWLPMTTSLWGLYLFAVAFSFGYSCGPVLMPSLVVETFGLTSFGEILGVINFCACIGCGIGPLLTGHLFDLTGSYTSAFILLAVLSILSALLSLVLAQVHHRQPCQ